MSARYWVLVSDDLIDARPQWPVMLRAVERGGPERPGMRWWLFEDDDAPEELNGREVELAIGWKDVPGGQRETVVTSRSLMSRITS